MATTQTSRQAPVQSPEADPFYREEHLATLAARFITHLFACPDLPPPSGHAKLPNFIAYALHRTKLPPAMGSSEPNPLEQRNERLNKVRAVSLRGH